MCGEVEFRHRYTKMKVLILSFLFGASVFAQNPSDARVITFNRTDTTHCRVITIDGKPLLETSFDGTSIAVAMPENKGDGEFSVFVSIYREGPGSVHVNPKDFSALYSDPAQTRFPFYDKAAEIESRNPAKGPDSGMSATTNEIDRSLIRGGPPGPGAAGLSPSDTLKGDNPPPGNPAAASGSAPVPEAPAPAPTPVFLKRATVKQGSKIAGVVFFRKPKGAKVQINPTDMLGEIDIPVNGITFRF